MLIRPLLVLAVFGAAALPAPAQEKLSFKKEKDTIDIFAGDRLLTTFRFGDYAKPIFYPMNTPAGVCVTRNWPFKEADKGEITDHPHQKSAWFCHGDVIAESVKPSLPIKSVEGHDFWSEVPGHGKIVAVSVGEPKITNGKLTFVVKNEWRASNGTKIMDETRTYHVIPLKGAWLLVMESNILASVSKIVFGDTKEGSFGIRISNQMTEKSGKGKLTNAQGMVGEKKVWGIVSEWCDYSGTIDGKEVGLTIYADPKNPHPTCWHARGYGLMAANPFGRNRAGFPEMKGRTDLVTIEKGQGLALRYGILVHDGGVQEGNVAEHFKTFVNARGK
jgi:hypothetical protein